MEQLDGCCKGYMLLGENPAVGSTNTRLQRLGMANLDHCPISSTAMRQEAD